jgi:hypothetical protein
MRSYERYPVVAYGIESVVLWPRLSMIIPEDAQNRVRESESLLQLPLNLLIAGFTNLVIYGCVVGTHLHSGAASRLSDALLLPVIPAMSVVSGWFGWWQLPTAASQRGEQVKAIFDLYRGGLAEALGFELPSTHQAEWTMWYLVSRRMMYRLLKDFRSLDKYRKRDYSIRSDKENTSRARSQSREVTKGEEGNQNGDQHNAEELDEETKT